MAKRKKSKGRKATRRRRGMGSVSSSDKVKRTVGLFTSLVAANLAQEGLAWLGEKEFLAASADAKINYKKAALSGGTMVLTGLGSVMIKNDIASAAMQGLSIGASMAFKDDVVKPVLGLGEVDDFLELYKKKDTVANDLGNTQPVQLGNVNPITLG